MAKMRTLMALLLVMALGSMAAAEWVPLPGDPVAISDLSQPYVVGDKAFSDFELLSAIGSGGALKPDFDSVYVLGGQDSETGDYGLRFFLSWNAGKGQVANAKFSFKVAVVPGSNYLIKDVSALFQDASATGSGLVNASETIFNAPEPGGDIIAQLEISKQENDGAVNLRDHAEFAPVKEIWVEKDISLTGGDEANGAAHLSGFFQFFSQVPEPATMCLLALGGLPLLRRRRR